MIMETRAYQRLSYEIILENFRKERFILNPFGEVLQISLMGILRKFFSLSVPCK